MVDYFEAIKRPFTDAKKLIIGIVLSIIPIVNFITLGYVLNCGKAPKGKLPEWKNWGDLFIKGLASIVIGLVYMIPALIVLFIGGVSIFTLGLMNASVSELISAVGGYFSLGFILALIGYYIVPAALMAYIKKGKFGAAFELKNLSKTIFKGDYFAGWLVSGIYMAAISIVIIAIPLLVGMSSSIVSMVCGGLARFIGLVTLFSIIGQISK